MLTLIILSVCLCLTVSSEKAVKDADYGAVLIGGFESGVESYPCSLEVPQLPSTLRSTAATIYNGSLQICGGWNIDDSFFDECRVVENGEWKSVSKLVVPRDEHTLNTLGDKMIVTGGYGDLKFLDVVEIFDGESWKRSADKLSIPRSGHCAVSISDTELVTIGGQTSNGGPILVSLPNIEMYEEGIGWYEIGEIYPPRFGHACALMGNEIIVSGGSAGDQVVEALNLETLEFRRLPSTIQKRWDHTMEIVNGQIHIFGGLWEPYTMEWFDGEEWHLEDLQFNHLDSTSAVLPCN